MSQQDQTTDKRLRNDGSAADRRPSTASATAKGAAAGLVIGLSDWFFLQCWTIGPDHHSHFLLVPPSSNLIEVAAPIILLPAGLWAGRILSLIGDIIENRLKKDANT